MLNLCQFIGHLGADPETRDANGQTVANFRIACSEKWKDKNGDAKERTEWVSVVTWGKLADVVAKYCTKGKQVYVSGRLQTRKWQDKDGNDRYTTEIVASEVKFLGSKNDGRDNRDERGQRDRRNESESDDGIPF